MFPEHMPLGELAIKHSLGLQQKSVFQAVKLPMTASAVQPDSCCAGSQANVSLVTARSICERTACVAPEPMNVPARNTLRRWNCPPGQSHLGEVYDLCRAESTELGRGLAAPVLLPGENRTEQINSSWPAYYKSDTINHSTGWMEGIKAKLDGAEARWATKLILLLEMGPPQLQAKEWQVLCSPTAAFREYISSEGTPCFQVT